MTGFLLHFLPFRQVRVGVKKRGRDNYLLIGHGHKFYKCIIDTFTVQMKRKRKRKANLLIHLHLLLWNFVEISVQLPRWHRAWWVLTGPSVGWQIPWTKPYHYYNENLLRGRDLPRQDGSKCDLSWPARNRVENLMGNYYLLTEETVVFYVIKSVFILFILWSQLSSSQCEEVRLTSFFLSLPVNYDDQRTQPLIPPLPSSSLVYLFNLNTDLDCPHLPLFILLQCQMYLKW